MQLYQMFSSSLRVEEIIRIFFLIDKGYVERGMMKPSQVEFTNVRPSCNISTQSLDIAKPFATSGVVQELVDIASSKLRLVR
ncbi:uncharacterized protein LY89DRAFT_689488 [Mollisia scopiformis]|uniref:Uncharacterized protein n=1 Tax=Mollisia scopiformis TaxID=149040 RepID=A0A194WSL4_MOLSC|nr:uncharacterized protein LY89DRAFT_689488 [Mollisia scopiformis]KUJ10948.1 hypothetical protein LY89DRAFT_689488 [Mollisia scopiformis]